MVNRGFKDDIPFDGKGGWVDLGKDDAAGLKSGKIEFKSIPFNIVNPVANNGKAVIALAGANLTELLPHEVTIPVNQDVDWFYFLNNFISGFDESGEHIVVKINYNDGTSSNRKLVCFRDLVRTDTYVSHNKTAPVISFLNSNGKKRVLNISQMENPNPEKKVQSITIYAQEGYYVCTSITTGVGTKSVLPSKFPNFPLWEKVKDDWFPSQVSWGDEISQVIGKGDNPLDFSRFLDAPAGKHGFVKTNKKGHFEFEDGTTARFWGGHISSCNPDAENAVKIADFLAFHGMNIVRLYNIKPLTFFRTPKQWKKLDRLVYELKKRGIYYYFNLTFFARARFYKKELDVLPSDSERLKFLVYQLMNHYNPYTKMRYADDPAMCFLELGNEIENTLRSFAISRILSKKARGTEEYVNHRLRYNVFIHENYQTVKEYMKAFSKFAPELKHLLKKGYESYSLELPDVDAPPELLFDLDAYLSQSEEAIWKEIALVARKAGAKIPINYNNHPFTLSGLKNRSGDFVGIHQYYGHPQWSRGKYSITQSYNIAGGRHFNRKPHMLYMGAVKGMPLHDGEANSANPNVTRSSAFPMWAAYGGLNQWDAVSWFATLIEPITTKVRNTGMAFNYGMDPSTMLPIQICGLVFLRGDFAPAKYTYNVMMEKDSFSRKNIKHNLFRERKLGFFKNCTYPWPTYDYEFISALSMISRVQISYGSESAEGENDNEIEIKPMGTGNLQKDYLKLRNSLLPAAATRSNQKIKDVIQGDKLISDTGQLKWDRLKGCFSAVSPKTIMITGKLNNGKEKLGPVEIDIKTKYGTIVLTSLDDLPITQSRKLLLMRVGDSGEKGRLHYKYGYYLENPDEPAYVITKGKNGNPPVFMCPVNGTISITFDSNDEVKVCALKNNGLAKMQIKTFAENNKISFQLLSNQKSVYYQIRR